MGAPASINPGSFAFACLFKRLPDPDKFENVRSDLCRFVSQIKEKMTMNRDRFPTLETRMIYVINRLKELPYAQILSYIKEGVCQLNNYTDILDILDRAYGDPNRVCNVCNALFALRQKNQEFSIFFVEFQCLIMESEMAEDGLATLLEHVINQKLKNMLLHHEPFAGSYIDLVLFLQKLENCRIQYARIRPWRPTSTKNLKNRSLADFSKSLLRKASPDIFRNQPTSPDLKPMDLSLSCRRSFSPRGSICCDRGKCFRCGSNKHLIRDCPESDNRIRWINYINYSDAPRAISFSRKLSFSTSFPYRTPGNLPQSPPLHAPQSRTEFQPERLYSPDPNEQLKGVCLI